MPIPRYRIGATDSGKAVGETAMHRVVVPHRARKRMKSELRRMGFNAATLFPDLDGLALDIRDNGPTDFWGLDHD
jgi:hypothetical protein